MARSATAALRTGLGLLEWLRELYHWGVIARLGFWIRSQMHLEMLLGLIPSKGNQRQAYLLVTGFTLHPLE